MKRWKWFLVLLAITSNIWAYNAYFENFNTAPPSTCGTTGNWCFNFPYGRNGFMLVDHRGAGQTSFLSIQQATGNYYTTAPATGGYLFLRGMANNVDIVYNNIWTGRMARYETLYNASATDPFGVQVIRYFAVIDPADREDNRDYNRSNIGLWLVQNNAVASETNFTASSPTDDWSTIPNAIYFYEMQINRDVSPIWGYFAGSDVNLNPNLATAPRTNLSGTDDIGSTVNGVIFTNNDGTVVHNARFVVSRQDTAGGMSTVCPAASTILRGYNVVKQNPGDLHPNDYNRYTNTINNTNSNMTCGIGNRREVGMRLTHDGTTVRMYLNPNPHGRTGTHNGVNYASYRNEWYRVGSQNVAFNSNMKVMLGQENLFFVTGLTEAVFDNFLIRPVAQSVLAEIIQPNATGEHRVLQGVSQRFGIKIAPTLNATDAGIGEIYIRKPSGTGDIYNGANWNRSTVVVCLDNDANASSGDACNQPGETRLTYRTGSNHATDNSTLTNTEFQAYTLNSDFTLATGDTGEILAIRLKKQNSPNNNHFTLTSAGAHIRVYFDLTATNTNYEGQNFEVWVHNEKFHDTAQEFALDPAGVRYATTEKMKATVVSSGDLLVKAFDTQPAATMAVSISPDPLYWGTMLPFATVEIRTPTTGNRPDVTVAVITLPSEGDIAPFDFELDDGTTNIALIDSLRIPASEEDDVNTDLKTFTTTTATIDDCITNNHRFCYYSNSANPNYRKLVVNYGVNHRIPGKSGYDRITFFLKQAPQFTANTQITTNWSGTVDSVGFINGTTPQTITPYQGNPANMQTIVRAQPPQTSAKISPTVLTNNVNNANPTTGTVTYFVKNNGGPSNHIKRLEILIPYNTYTCPVNDPHETDCNGTEPGTGSTRENMAYPSASDFTNLKINGSPIIPAPTVTVVGNETIGSTDYRVVRIEFDDSAKLSSGQTFSVDMGLKYYRNTNEPNQTFTIRHRADNENYSTPPAYPYPRYSDGGEDATGTWTLTLTPPKPMGEAFVFRGDHTVFADQAKAPVIYTNEITSGNVVLNMKLYNRGGVGNNINDIEIHVPSFYNVVDACSTYLEVSGSTEYCESHTGSNIQFLTTPFSKTIKINYNGASYPLKSSFDTMTATPCPTETNVPCEIVRITLQQDPGLSDPSLSDEVFTITDSDSDGVFETMTGPSADGNNTRRSGSFFAKLNNASNAVSYTRESTGKSFTSRLEFPDPAAESFVTTQYFLDGGLYEVDATQPNTTFKIFVKNTATLAGNEIYKLDIQFPTAPTIVSGTPNVDSILRDHNGSVNPINSTNYTVGWNSAAQILTITYDDSYRLPPSLAMGDGTSYVDIITISFTDTVTTTGYRPISVVAYNKVGSTATGKSVTASLYNGSDPDDNYNNSNNHDQNIFYKIPQGYGTATVMPKMVYTTTGTFTVQSKFYLQNKAPSSTTNYIHKVEIKLPANVTVANALAVSARSGATVNCLGGDGFTNGCVGPTESVEIDYTTASPPYLDPQNDADDEVLVTWSHTIGTEGNIQFQVRFDNNDGGGYAASNLEPVPASLYTVGVYHEPKMKIEVISQPGDPVNPASMVNDQTIRSTVPAANYHRFQLVVTPTANPAAAKIHRLRILPPSYLDASSLDVTDALPAGTTMSYSAGYIYVDFPGGQLTSANTTLKFRLKDNRLFNVPGTHNNDEDEVWQVHAAFFHDLMTNSTYTHTNLPGPTFAGKLVADGLVDEVVYVPTSNYNTARNLAPVPGSGAAGLTWDTTRMTNPTPKFVMYLRPKDVFRINTGDPPYSWTQQIHVVNQGEVDNDIRFVEFKPDNSLFSLSNSELAGCTTSGPCDLDSAPFVVKKGITGQPESTFTTLTYGMGNDYYLRSVESGTATYQLSVPQTIRLYLSEAQRLKHNETLIIQFGAKHGHTATGSFLWSFKAGNYNPTVPASNNSDPVPLGESETTTVVNPSYSSNFMLSAINGIAGKTDISAQSSRNTFRFTLSNNSSGGDVLTEAKIHFPGFFNVATATVTSIPPATVTTNSSTTPYDTNGIESSINAVEWSSFNKNNYILLNFGSGLNPGQSAVIDVTIDDTFFHDSPITMTSRIASGGGFISRFGNTGEPPGMGGNNNGTCEPGETCSGRVTIKASAKYSTSGGAFQFINAFPSRADSLEIVQTNAVGYAWVVSNNIPMEGTAPRDQVIEVRIKNGAANNTTANGNIIYRAKIRIPRASGSISEISTLQWRKSGSTTWTNLTGSCDSAPVCSGNFSGNGTDYFAYLDFEPAGGLLPGETAEVRFTIKENFTSNAFIDLAFRVDNNRWLDTYGRYDLSHPSIIDNSVTFNQGDLAVTELATQTLRVNFIPPDSPSEGFVHLSVDREIVTGVYNSSAKKFEFSNSQLNLLATYCNPASPSLSIACDARFTLYTLGDNDDIYYEIKNGSSNYALEELKLRLSIFDATTAKNWSLFEIESLTSERLGTMNSPTCNYLDLYQKNDDEADDPSGSDGTIDTCELTINYSSLPGGGIPVGEKDIIRVALKLKPAIHGVLTAPDTGNISYTNTGKQGGFHFQKSVEFFVSAQTKRATLVGYKDVSFVNDKQNYFYIRKAPFGRITGLVAPKEAPVSFQIIKDDGNVGNIYGSSYPLPTVSAGNDANTNYGRFTFDRVPAGLSYAIKMVSADPQLDVAAFVITREDAQKTDRSYFPSQENSTTRIENLLRPPYTNIPVEIYYRQLNAAVDNEVRAPLDSRTRIILPAGTLDNNPRINIRIEPVSAQAWDVLNHSQYQMNEISAKGIANVAAHKVYNLLNELPKTGQLTPVVENQLKNEATLILGFDLADFPGVDPKKLKAFYWDITRRRWIKLGGLVNTSDQTVTIKITYMHRTYTLLPDEEVKGIANVTVFPRVFTPGRTDSAYREAMDQFGSEKTFGNLKLTFELGADTIGQKYEVGIYNMSGRLMRKWVKENTTGQGSIYWDGRDEFGGLVAGGIYVYVIRIGDVKYRGTLLVAR